MTETPFPKEPARDERASPRVPEEPARDERASRRAVPTRPPKDGGDSTVVIVARCAECGFAPPEPERVARLIRDTVPRVRAALARSNAATRPSPETWSPLEYACHLRDLAAVFCDRVDAVAAEDGASFPDWDAHAAAVAGRYGEQRPKAVAEAYARGAERLARRFDAVRPDEWTSRGVRNSDGEEFTLAELAVYVAHELTHHARAIQAVSGP